jgi:hypothetical protein
MLSLLPNSLSNKWRNALPTLTGVGIIFIAAIIGCVHRSVLLRKDVQVGDTLVRLDKLPDVDLIDVRSSHPTRVQDNDARMMLVVFLSGADCWSCMGELPDWKRLAEKYPSRSFGELFVFVRTNANEIAGLPDTLFSPSANIVIDGSGELDRQLGLPQKIPLTVLLEPGTHKVLLAEGADSEYAFQQKFVASIEQILHARGGA